MLLTLELLPQILGRMSVKTSAPGCHPTFLLRRHQELDEGGPCQHSGNTYKAMWEKAMEKKAWKALPLGRAEGGLHGLCYPQASCGPAGQRSESEQV